ncbi:MAG: hypothetical protein HYS89_01500 [Candidatus Colwellbacteria bacterium]|nr:hypothetical protein [Candidatus Colwellbacteria bacterium]
MREEGWELVESIDEEPAPVSRLELVSFLRRGESYVSGETMRERVREEGASLGQRQAEYLRVHQEEIPSEWREFYLVLPGTVWRDRDGDLYVPYLYWHGGRWYMLFHRLERDWYSNGRLVSRK